MLSRRKFIKSSALAASTFAITPSWAKAANSDVRVAVVGVRGRGKSLIADVFRTEGARLVALCDVDTVELAKRAAAVDEEYGVTVSRETDYRKLLERNDVDAVVLTTPNHWHALQTIWGCEAGKDVYVEKPVCHTVWEGRQMVAAAKKYNRIVQAGFQNRSDVGLQEAFPWIHAGNIGEIKMVRGLCYRNRASIGKIDTSLVPPKSVDYDKWLGPAEHQDLYRPELHYDWHWDFNTGNGDLGNQGPHELDIMRWILGDPDHPVKIQSLGGRFGWDDAGDTPNMGITTFDWGGIPALFEVRNLWVKPELNNAPNFKGSRVGVIVTCEGGEFRGGRGGGFVYDNDGERVKAFKGDRGSNHFPAFVKAVNSRKESDVAAHLESAYKSSCLAHLGNISYLKGKDAEGKSVEKFASKDGVLEETLGRYNEQMAEWSIDQSKELWKLGPELEFDARSEKFTGGDSYKQANKLLKKNYRPRYAVPSIA